MPHQALTRSSGHEQRRALPHHQQCRGGQRRRQLLRLQRLRRRWRIFRLRKRRRLQLNNHGRENFHSSATELSAVPEETPITDLGESEVSVPNFADFFGGSIDAAVDMSSMEGPSPPGGPQAELDEIGRRRLRIRGQRRVVVTSAPALEAPPRRRNGTVGALPAGCGH